MRALLGPLAKGLISLVLFSACTRANPAYHPRVYDEDAGDSTPALERDSAPPADRTAPPPPDLAAPDPSVPPDAAAPAPDLAPTDLATPDLAAPDLALPRDLSPYLPPDAGISTMNLVAHWRFDERSGTNAADSSGNGNTGTTHNGPTWTATGFPGAKFPNAGALVLDGQDDYVEIAQKGIPGNAVPKTLSAWFKAVNPGGIITRNLVALINDTNDVGIQLGIDHSQIASWYYGAASPKLIGGALIDGNWHHAAYTFDGKMQRLYLDGRVVAVATEVPAAGPILNTRIGTYQAPDEMFAGTIDDVRIYSRALSDAEVMTLWSGQP